MSWVLDVSDWLQGTVLSNLDGLGEDPEGVAEKKELGRPNSKGPNLWEVGYIHIYFLYMQKGPFPPWGCGFIGFRGSAPLTRKVELGGRHHF